MRPNGTIENVGAGKWQRGKPPTPGWYNASPSRNTHVLRWFDGRRWGGGCFSAMTTEEAVLMISQPPRPGIARFIEWRPLRSDIKEVPAKIRTWRALTLGGQV